VVEHVHDLQHDAGRGPPLALLRRDQEQVAHGDALGQLLGDAEVQMTLHVLDRLLPQVLQAVHVQLAVRIELIYPEETINLGPIGEIQAVPVDHRAATQQVADGGHVSHREAVERAADRSHAPARGRHRGPGFRADITVLPVRSGKAEASRGVYCHRCTNVVAQCRRPTVPGEGV
jgi:hypothetical protein